MRNKGLIFVLIVVIAILVLFSGYSEPKKFVENMTYEKTSDLLFTYEITRYPSKVEIIPFEEKNITVGLVADPWNLNFGVIPLGGYGRRQIQISNFEDYKVRVYFKVYGQIKPLIKFSKDNFVLLPKQSETVIVFLNTSKDIRVGNFYGQIDVIVKKPNFDLLSNLI